MTTKELTLLKKVFKEYIGIELIQELYEDECISGAEADCLKNLFKKWGLV